MVIAAARWRTRTWKAGPARKQLCVLAGNSVLATCNVGCCPNEYEAGINGSPFWLGAHGGQRHLRHATRIRTAPNKIRLSCILGWSGRMPSLRRFGATVAPRHGQLMRTELRLPPRVGARRPTPSCSLSRSQRCGPRVKPAQPPRRAE